MRRFLITTETNAYTGEAELVYKDDGMLCKINLENAQMNRAITSSFKKMVPDHVDDLAIVFANTKAVVVEVDFDVTFEMFWEKYNRKINKSRCIALWNKLSKADQVKAFYGIDKYEKFLKKEHWRPKADPETYLRNQYWMNEYR